MASGYLRSERCGCHSQEGGRPAQRFDPPTFSWIDEGGDVIGAPTFSLSGSEVEMLHIWAYVEDEWVEWTAELLVLVDGHRQVIEISEGGQPFVTSVSAGAASQHRWISGGDHWDSSLPL